MYGREFNVVMKRDVLEAIFFLGCHAHVSGVFQIDSFKGKYTFFDTPLFFALQNYFLQCSD